jgi:hypothetical protein
MTLALDYGRRAERQRPEEPDVDPQVRFCERDRSRGRSLLDPVVRAERATTGLRRKSDFIDPGRGRVNTMDARYRPVLAHRRA